MNRKRSLRTFAPMLHHAWIAVVSREAQASGPFQYFAVTVPGGRHTLRLI